jgi:hypothetical protein
MTSRGRTKFQHPWETEPYHSGRLTPSPAQDEAGQCQLDGRRRRQPDDRGAGFSFGRRQPDGVLVTLITLLTCLVSAVGGASISGDRRGTVATPVPPVKLGFVGLGGAGTLSPVVPPADDSLTRLRLPAPLGKPKIAYSFNPEDDLDAIRDAGFTHVLVSYLQGAPDEVQRRKLDDCRRAGLKLIYRMVDLVDRDRRSGGDSRMQHAVLLLRDHPALAGWQTFEETNLPIQQQVAVYRKIKSWDPRHPVITVVSNEYSPGWYRRTFSPEAQDLVMIDYYPYKRSYDGWVYIRMSVPSLVAASQSLEEGHGSGKEGVTRRRSVPIIPIIQASSSTRVPSAENTFWPPPGGLEKQLNLWWSLGADAGVAFWVWRGSKDYPFVGIADRDAPPYALRETRELLHRIRNGELSGSHRDATVARHAGDALSLVSRLVPAVRVWQPRVNELKNSGFEQGLEGWIGHNERATASSHAYAGHGAARMEWAGAPKAMGVGQRTDLRVPPNATVTFSCYYKVVRETSLLQWMVNTTAYPAFGAAEFLERKEHLSPGDWRRASISATNSTGAPQRVTSVAVISNGFTGEVLLDNFQLELAPAASPYTDRTRMSVADAGTAGVRMRGRLVQQSGPTGLRYHLPGQVARTAGRVPRLGRRGGIRPSGADRRSRELPTPGWTALAWSAPEMTPEEGSYACLAALEDGGSALELHLRVDAKKSDRNGWSGVIDVVVGRASIASLPIALAPGQPLFWALSADSQGGLTLRAAPAGYRLESRSSRGSVRSAIRSVVLGADADGRHPLNGLVAGGQVAPRPLSPGEIEQVRSETGD